MRTRNSIQNTITNIGCNISIIFIGLISQAIFIRILGAEYLGINGLFTNILSILNIAELGIGNAIIYNLYKPVATNDIEKIKSLVDFYRKAYNLIAIIIVIVGLAIMPFLPFFVGEISINLNLTIIYFLFLIQTVSSYILTFRTSILIATQKNYIVKINNLFFRLTTNIFQLILLFFTKNYYLYLVVAIATQLFFNWLINKKALKLYSYLNDKHSKKLSAKIEKNIFSKVKALFFHKIGGFLVNSTDNIIISKFINVYTVGLYSNYYLVINATTVLVNQMISGISASVGNLLATESREKTFNIFKKVKFLNYWISTFGCICLLCLVQPFICIWVGEEYLLSTGVIITLTLNFYQTLMRNCFSVFKDAAGVWEQDKYVPILESILNIVFSIILLHFFGLAGVFMGTIISSLALWCFSYPKFIYKGLFQKKYKDYIFEILFELIVFIFISFVAYTSCRSIHITNTIVQLLINLIICITIPNLILFIIYRKNENFIYYKKLLIQLTNKITRKKVSR